MHNNIMAAGSRDRPPILATGRYAQWRSRFLRYIDTRPNGDALRKCILKGPNTSTIVTTPAVPTTKDSPAVPEQTTVETVMNMTHKNRAHFESEKEAIHLILTGIGDEIYSTVDACGPVVQQSGIQCFNCKEFGHYAKECRRKPKEQSEWLADTAEEIDEQELEAHYSYMAKIQEVPNADSGTNSEPLEQLDVDENKKIQKQLKKANATLTQELTECKSILAETSRTLGESNRECDCLAQKLSEQEFFDKPSVVRQPNAQRIPKPSVLGKPTPFLDSHERLFCKEKVSFERLSTGVAHKTNVSRPQPRSNQMKDKVVPNTSHEKFKKTEVEEHPRISSISNQTKSITACNDSLNSKTSNVNAVCATCGKCTVHFGNDQFALILSYGDLVQGNITIIRVYYVEGLNHNLLSVGQFCDTDLEDAFWKSTCFVRDLQGNDLLTGNRGTDLYTISLQETTSSTPICLMAKASPTQAWLWH
ncbi:retrovirus-related pol polyprotein from transposon TNT 1-94 [Tanacetum coccineum]